jgi:glycosyltransferase involved in cell wall biosynthesis
LAELPFVSVVVPLYNEERWIDECLRALSAQQYPEDRYEILVIDNNSTDRSAERVALYPRVRLLREPVQGDFAARNRGIVEARGDILAFTDADTAPHPDWIRSIVEHMNGGVCLLVGRLEFGGRSRSLELLEAYEAEKGEFVFSSGIPSIYFGYTCNMAVNRALFDRIGLFAPVFRNADVVLVRRTVDELSPSALAFCDAMRVRRLEVPSVRQYYQKQMTYGRDFPRYAKLAGARTLDAKQRFEVFGRTVRRNRLGPIDTGRLLAILAVGAVSYELAKRRARRPDGAEHV